MHNIKEHNYSWVHWTPYRLQLLTALLAINEKESYNMHQTMHTQYTQNKSHTKYNITHCLLQGTYNNHSKYF